MAGGTSGEREISIASGQGAGAALKEAGFNVTTLDPADKGDLVRLIQGGFDVAFLCLHGKNGEDGTIQGMLEIIGVPYTGPGVWSSATAMDKAKAKIFYQENGIPTPPSVTLFSKGEAVVDDLVVRLGDHVVVKPATEGSALGVSIVEGVQNIGAALDAAFALDREVLVERYVGGTELTVAVIGNDDPCALPVIEIVPKTNSMILNRSTPLADRSTSARLAWIRKPPRRFSRSPSIRTRRWNAVACREPTLSWTKTVRAGCWRPIRFPA